MSRMRHNDGSGVAVHLNRPRNYNRKRLRPPHSLSQLVAVSAKAAPTEHRLKKESPNVTELPKGGGDVVVFL